MGECVVESFFGNLKILRADERIRISHWFLEDVADLHPDVSYGDGILTIRASNGTVSYGIGPPDPFTNTHEGTRSGSWSL